jgi:deoxyribose-phosphate aldolase
MVIVSTSKIVSSVASGISSQTPGANMNPIQPRYSAAYIADHLDYAVLSPLATICKIKEGAALCNRHKIKSYCVASANVAIAASMHDNVSAVIGFPHGNSSPYCKYAEAIDAISGGAKELDVVVNYGRYLGGDDSIIDFDLRNLCAMAKSHGVLVKAILESCHYTRMRLARACNLAIWAGVDYLKTSTGFGPGPATPEDVATMVRATCGTDVRVKASGGIKTYVDAAMYLDLGCDRLGASRYTELCYAK